MRWKVWLAVALLGLGLVFPVGQRTAAAAFVDPEQIYTYELMTRDLHAMAEAYPTLVTLKSLGQTPYGREIWAVGLGTGPAPILINGAHHASEWLTASLVSAMADRYAAAAATGGKLDDVDVRELLQQVTIWFVPMVNPDGVTLAQLGLDAFPAGARETLLALNGGSTDFRRWKANAQGVDLNRQYPADWEHIAGSPEGPAAMNYKGPAPLVAPEVQALADFTREIQPELAIAYHSAGRVIYWHFHTAPEHVWRDERIALRLGDLTGYSLVAPEENPSGGGYKDWFVQEFGRPGYTIEIGDYGDGQPLSVPAFAPEWDRNQAVGLIAAQEGYRLWEAHSRVRLVVDGVPQPDDRPALLIGGQTFAPLPDLLTGLGAKVSLDEAAGTLTASHADTTIQLTLGSRRALLTGNPLNLPNPPLRLGGQFYGPLRFAAEEMGATVTWDEATHSVQVQHTHP